LANPQEFIEQLLRELRAWTGPDAELQDDVTVVVVDVGPPETAEAMLGGGACERADGALKGPVLAREPPRVVC
jgi:hypothetical protein